MLFMLLKVQLFSVSNMSTFMFEFKVCLLNQVITILSAHLLAPMYSDPFVIHKVVGCYPNQNNKYKQKKLKHTIVR